ncbi:MAG: serine/threonine protein kinase, partial [Rubrivivax sp.]
MNRPSSSDDGPTVIRTGPTGGPHSDFAPSSTLWSDSLPEGLRLGEYEIRSVIGEGGFGIVYLAYDHFLQRQVALKEYMPSTLAGRARTGLDVVVKAERHRETFLAGLRSFVNEARLLAQFDHPALVKVYRFWEAHGTAYMVMPYCIGPTLKEALSSHEGPPDEDWLRHHLLGPLLEALALLHKAQCLHRDIAPDNILLTDTGPLLLDFGAARQIIGDMSQTLTVVLKPGYAPIEQYGEVASMGQGAWTDLYALAGVVRYAITGKVPVAATSRIMQDTLVPLAQLVAGQYSDIFLRTMDAALAVKPADRPQNVAAFQALLEGSEPMPPASPVPDASALAPSDGPASRAKTGLIPTTGLPRTTASPDASARTGPRSWSPTTAPGSATRPSPLDALAGGPAGPRTTGKQPAAPQGVAASPAKAESGARQQGGMMFLAGGLILLALGAGGWMF